MPLIVAIEGIDGSGKQTATAAVSQILRENNHSVTTQDFPRYGTPLVNQIKSQILSTPSTGPVPYDTALHNGTLFTQDRADWAHNEYPKLSHYDVIILDRFRASNLAYQMSTVTPAENQKLRIELDEIESAAHGITPDLTVLLSVTPEEALRRRRTRQTADEDDAYESNMELQQKVFSNYLALSGPTTISKQWLISDDASRIAEHIINTLN